AFTPSTGDLLTNPSAVAQGGGSIVAVGDGIIYSTDNGQTWTKAPDVPTNFRAVAYGAGRFAAATADGKIYYSTNGGASWIIGSGFTGNPGKMTFGGDRFVVATYNSGVYYSDCKPPAGAETF